MADGPPAETEAAIREAVRSAFATHGYADLSMAKIAAEFDGSQSLLHYHFDTREGLVVYFLRREREGYEESLAAFPEDPGERFEAVLSSVIDLDYLREHDLFSAYLELYGHAAHSDPIREELVRFDEMLFGVIRAAVVDGIEAGVLRDVDPDLAARAIFAVHESAFLRASLGWDPGDLRGAFARFVLRELFADDPPARWQGGDPA